MHPLALAAGELIEEARPEVADLDRGERPPRRRRPAPRPSPGGRPGDTSRRP